MEEVRAMPEIPLPDLMAYFDAVRAVTRHYLEQATEADLAQEYSHPRLGPLTGTWIVGHILVEGDSTRRPSGLTAGYDAWDGCLKQGANGVPGSRSRASSGRASPHLHGRSLAISRP